MLAQLREARLAEDSKVGVSATAGTNASLQTLRSKDNGEDYESFVKHLAEASALNSPTREELIEFDRQREPKEVSNEHWVHPMDPDARVTKM